MKIHFGEKSNRKPNQNHQKTESKSSVHSRHFKRIVQQSENNTFVLKNNVRQKQEKKKRSWEWKNVLVFIDVRNHIEIIKNETKKKYERKTQFMTDVASSISCSLHVWYVSVCDLLLFYGENIFSRLRILIKRKKSVQCIWNFACTTDRLINIKFSGRSCFDNTMSFKQLPQIYQTMRVHLKFTWRLRSCAKQNRK